MHAPGRGGKSREGTSLPEMRLEQPDLWSPRRSQASASAIVTRPQSLTCVAVSTGMHSCCLSHSCLPVMSETLNGRGSAWRHH